MFDTQQFTRILQNDNEIAANSIMQVIRQNISMYDFGKDKNKFLQEKKKEILAILKQYDEEALKIFYNELYKINSRHLRTQSERETAVENRSFAKKIQTNFDRSDSYKTIKSKNLGIIEA